jgi:hypothetical protein
MTTLMSPDTPREISTTSGSSRRVDIAVEAECRLRHSSYLSLQDVSCDACSDVVRLSGCLPSYYLKQVAQEVVSEVEGVRGVVNLIKVIVPACRPPVGREWTTWGENKSPRSDGSPNHGWSRAPPSTQEGSREPCSS